MKFMGEYRYPMRIYVKDMQISAKEVYCKPPLKTNKMRVDLKSQEFHNSQGSIYGTTVHSWESR